MGLSPKSPPPKYEPDSKPTQTLSKSFIEKSIAGTTRVHFIPSQTINLSQTGKKIKSLNTVSPSMAVVVAKNLKMSSKSSFMPNVCTRSDCFTSGGTQTMRFLCSIHK